MATAAPWLLSPACVEPHGTRPSTFARSWREPLAKAEESLEWHFRQWCHAIGFSAQFYEPSAGVPVFDALASALAHAVKCDPHARAVRKARAIVAALSRLSCAQRAAAQALYDPQPCPRLLYSHMVVSSREKPVQGLSLVGLLPYAPPANAAYAKAHGGRTPPTRGAILWWAERSRVHQSTVVAYKAAHGGRVPSTPEALAWCADRDLADGPTPKAAWLRDTEAWALRARKALLEAFAQAQADLDEENRIESAARKARQLRADRLGIGADGP